VTRRVVPLTRDTLGTLPPRCRTCVFWELTPVAGDRARTSGDPAREKEAWLSATLLDWGSCGRMVVMDGVTAAYAIFAPPVHVPRSASFATSPVAGDAVLLTTLYVLPAYRGTGLGRLLVQTVAKDLLQRDVHAIEAFGELRPSEGCLIPADFLLPVGFKTVRPHARHPRLRLDLRSTVTWREDVEGAIERLLGAITHPEGALRPI
jgi:GNAT superfamily N-acetyltransferase